MEEIKDSGIEWVGKIPKDWDVIRCKYISTFLNGYAFDSTDLQMDFMYPVIRIGDIKNGGKYSLQGTTQGRYLTGGVPPVRFSM